MVSNGTAVSFAQNDIVVEKVKYYVIIKMQITKEDKLMPIIHVNKDNFQTEVMNAAEPVLVDFWAAWCGPCRMLSPVLDAVAEEREDIKICKINVDEEPELAAQYEVMSIPTLMVFDKGQIVKRELGALPKHEVLQML
jgi:thioredoxin 1